MESYRPILDAPAWVSTLVIILTAAALLTLLVVWFVASVRIDRSVDRSLEHLREITKKHGC